MSSSCPPLTPGKTYTYDIRAQWREDGRDVTQTRNNASMKPQTAVLYVAKDNVARPVLADALRKAGLNVREATTGSEALASVDEKPDLILLAVDLPDVSGFEVCRRLKADPRLAATPVLLLSATLAEEADRLQALAAGADDYVVEPVEPAELLGHIEALLRVHQSEGSGEENPEDP